MIEHAEFEMQLAQHALDVALLRKEKAQLALDHARQIKHLPDCDISHCGAKAFSALVKVGSDQMAYLCTSHVAGHMNGIWAAEPHRELIVYPVNIETWVSPEPEADSTV